MPLHPPTRPPGRQAARTARTLSARSVSDLPQHVFMGTFSVAVTWMRRLEHAASVFSAETNVRSLLRSEGGWKRPRCARVCVRVFV